MIVKLPPADGRGKPGHRPSANAAQIVPARESGGGAPDFLDLGVPALDRVAGSWRGLRGREAMPSSDRLYISDFVAEMTYLVIGYRIDDGFQVEFQGAAVRALVGEDLVGTVPTAGSGNTGIAWIARSFAGARALGAPVVDRFLGPTGPQTGVFLPYADPAGRVSVILAAIAMPDTDGVSGTAMPVAASAPSTGPEPPPSPTGGEVVVPMSSARRRPRS